MAVQVQMTAQQNPSVSIVNDTGYTVYYVHFSAADSDDWSDDLLDRSQVLSDGEEASVVLPFPLSVADRYDIVLIDSDGDSYIKLNVPVSVGSKVVFTFDDFIGQDDYYDDSRNNSDGMAFNGEPYITITNNTGYTVISIFLNPSPQEEDRMAEGQALPSGNSLALRLPFPLSEVSRYDIILVDIDGDSYTKRNVSVSANGTVVFVFDDIDW